MQKDKAQALDSLSATMDRGRDLDDRAMIEGILTIERFNEDGDLVGYCRTKNLITAVGDQLYASRGAGLSTSAAPTGIKLGTGSTAVAKTGAGAALTTYLSGSNKAFDATFPQAAAGVATYKRTYAPGEATTASPITEAVVVNDTIATDATSAAAATICRALVTGVGSKQAGDTLIVTWTNTILGA